MLKEAFPVSHQKRRGVLQLVGVLFDDERQVDDHLRTKQPKPGLTQLGEEGAIQVFRPKTGDGAAADERGLKRALEANWPKIKLHELREHVGLVFQKNLEG